MLKASLRACMPPWSIGNALAVKHHAVSMLAVMSPKEGIFCIGLYGECQGTLSIVYFYVVECSSCTNVLNKPIKVFLHAY